MRSTRSDRSQSWAARHLAELAWTAFAVVNLAAMFQFPSWETIPFHLIWVSFALLYGVRAWGPRSSVLALAVVGLATGLLITFEGLRQHVFPARAIEAPLMTAMFAAMVWHVRRYLSVLRHAREVSQANRGLLERERRFVQNASHELRTPVTVALGHAELLARYGRDEEEKEDFAILIDELKHLRRLTDQLLTLSTLDEPGLLHPAPVDTARLLGQATRRWTPVDRQWAETSAAGDAGITVQADAQRLRAALDALIDNAVKHTSPGDPITLSAAREDGTCVITVTDAGRGFPPGSLPHAFERFHRAGGDPARERDGFGLGLSVVKAVAEAHHGTVRVTSAPAGTSVSIVIPAEPAPLPHDMPALPGMQPYDPDATRVQDLEPSPYGPEPTR